MANNLPEAFLAVVRKLPHKVHKRQKNGNLLPKFYRVWKDQHGIETPIPHMRTDHLFFILRYAYSKWDNGMPDEIWRNGWLPHVLEELEYRERLDNNRKTT